MDKARKAPSRRAGRPDAGPFGLAFVLAVASAWSFRNGLWPVGVVAFTLLGGLMLWYLVKK